MYKFKLARLIKVKQLKTNKVKFSLAFYLDPETGYTGQNSFELSLDLSLFTI